LQPWGLFSRKPVSSKGFYVPCDWRTRMRPVLDALCEAASRSRILGPDTSRWASAKDALGRHIIKLSDQLPFVFLGMPMLLAPFLFLKVISVNRACNRMRRRFSSRSFHTSLCVEMDALAPPLFTGRLGARSFLKGLTLFPSEVTSRVSSRAPLVEQQAGLDAFTQQ
jgi:hypothetical protein